MLAQVTAENIWNIWDVLKTWCTRLLKLLNFKDILLTFDMLYLNNIKHFVWYVFCSGEVSSIGVLV